MRPRMQLVAEVQDAGRSFVRGVTPAAGSSCTLRLNTTSTAYLTVPAGHRVVPELENDGMRAIVWLKLDAEDGTSTKLRLLEGRVGDMTGTGPLGTVTIPVRDDFDMLNSLLGWQGSALVSGKIPTEYASYTGPSDTRALAAIQAAVTRLALPWDVAASAGLGTVGTTDLRMDELSAKVLDPLTADRLQLRIRRNHTTDRWQVDVHQGETFERVLTPRSGVLTAWQWVRQQPTLTRVVVGGRGQDVNREFVVVVDTAFEAQLGVILEGFVNAGSSDEGADLTALGWEALKAARGKAGIAATLQEASWFRFPDAYAIADRLQVQVGAEPIEDAITEITVTQNQGGVTAVPKIGLTVNTPEERLTRAVADVARAARTLERK